MRGTLQPPGFSGHARCTLVRSLRSPETWVWRISPNLVLCNSSTRMILAPFMSRSYGNLATALTVVGGKDERVFGIAMWVFTSARGFLTFLLICFLHLFGSLIHLYNAPGIRHGYCFCRFLFSSCMRSSSDATHLHLH